MVYQNYLNKNRWGSWVPTLVALEADLRVDLPKYRIYRNGELTLVSFRSFKVFLFTECLSQKVLLFYGGEFPRFLGLNGTKWVSDIRLKPILPTVCSRTNRPTFLMFGFIVLTFVLLPSFAIVSGMSVQLPMLCWGILIFASLTHLFCHVSRSFLLQ